MESFNIKKMQTIIEMKSLLEEIKDFHFFKGPMSAIPGLDAVSVTNALSSFSNFIAQSEKLRLDLITRVSSTRIRLESIFFIVYVVLFE